MLVFASIHSNIGQVSSLTSPQEVGGVRHTNDYNVNSNNNHDNIKKNPKHIKVISGDSPRPPYLFLLLILCSYNYAAGFTLRATFENKN